MTTLPAVTDRDFDRAIEKATRPVLMEFRRPGCGHCHALMVELEAVQRETGAALQIVTMNVEENFQVPAEMEIQSLPALALYREGRSERFIGGIGTKKHILNALGLPVSDSSG